MGLPVKKIERETGIEPATFSLARRRYTTKPLAQIVLMFSTTSDNILYDSHFVNNNLGNIYENYNNPFSYRIPYAQY